jgi:ABC-2 type transport system permease protein
MRKVWAIVRRELQQVSKNPVPLAINLLLPILLIVALGQINFGGASSGAFAISIPVITEDTGAGAQTFKAALQQIPGVTLEEMSLQDAKDHVQTKGDRGGYIVIEPGFSQAFAAGQSAKLTVVTSTDSGGQVVRSFVQAVANRFNTTGLMVQAAQQQAQQGGQGASFNAQAAAQQAQTIQQTAKPVIDLDIQTAGGANFNSFDQVAPGYATMFVILGLNIVATTVINERTKGTLRRLAVMPVPRWAFLTGKMIAQFIVSFLQVAIMLAVAALFFGAHINGSNILGVFLLVVVLSFAATSLGILIASLIKSENGIRPVILIVGILGALLGGSWFPLWLMPDWMQAASKITINSWAMNGFNNLMIFGQGLSQILPNLLALLIYGAVCLFIAARFFSFTETA